MSAENNAVCNESRWKCVNEYEIIMQKSSNYNVFQLNCIHWFEKYAVAWYHKMILLK